MPTTKPARECTLLPHLQIRWPQLRNVSLGCAMHTTQLSGAAAAISLRATSMRRSVSTSLQAGGGASAA